MYRIFARPIFSLGLAIVLCQMSFGQVNTEKLLNKVGLGKTNTKFIPDSAFAGGVVFPRILATDPKFDIFPREIVTAWGKKELGFDPMLITQATLVVKPIEMGQDPVWAAVLHFEEMQGLAGGLIDSLEKRKVGDKTLFRGNGPIPSFLIYDEVTILVGDESMFEDMVASKGTGRVASLVKNAGVSGEVQAFADIAAIRPLLNQVFSVAMPGALPPDIRKIAEIPDIVDAIEVGLTVDGSIKTTLIVHATEEEQAEEAQKIINNALDIGLELGIGFVATQMDFNDPVQAATVEYIQRAGEDYKERLSPKLNGRKMSVALDQEATVVPFAVGMLLPAVQQTRAAARRTSSMNNMRQMTLASHNYLSTHGHFPAQASYDKNGKPLLSWRVHILPYIEQQELYDQFRLDEPWDSPHNKKLIKYMPPSFRSPSSAAPNGKTVYLGIAGEGMAFNGDKKIGVDKMTDGTVIPS